MFSKWAASFNQIMPQLSYLAHNSSTKEKLKYEIFFHTGSSRSDLGKGQYILSSFRWVILLHMKYIETWDEILLQNSDTIMHLSKYRLFIRVCLLSVMLKNDIFFHRSISAQTSVTSLPWYSRSFYKLVFCTLVRPTVREDENAFSKKRRVEYFWHNHLK